MTRTDIDGVRTSHNLHMFRTISKNVFSYRPALRTESRPSRWKAGPTGNLTRQHLRCFQPSAQRQASGVYHCPVSQRSGHRPGSATIPRCYTPALLIPVHDIIHDGALDIERTRKRKRHLSQCLRLPLPHRTRRHPANGHVSIAARLPLLGQGRRSSRAVSRYVCQGFRALVTE